MNRKLLASAICAGLFVAGSAYAQNNPAPQPAQGPTTTANPQTLGTVTVTGTRIRQAEIETAQPVLVVSRQEIEHQGLNTVAGILQNLTIAGTPPISRSRVLASGENVGGYYIDLRNLGASRTLVLLNGKRLGATTSGLSDLQQVPVAAIERIEILKDGASAIYGSDAIAGVVNIITRRNFNGAEASAYVGQYDEGDGKSQTYSMTLGTKTEKSSVMLVAEYSKDDPVWASSRWFSAYPSTNRHPLAGWTNVSQWGQFTNPFFNPKVPGSGAPWCAGQFCTLNPGADPSNPANYHVSNRNTNNGSTADLSLTNQEQMLQTGLERRSVFASGTYDFNDHLHFQTDILYDHRDTTAQVAGYPFQSGAFNLPGSTSKITLSPGSYFNPFGTGPLSNKANKSITVARRGWEVPRVTDSELTTYRIGGTLTGDFDIAGHNWVWDVDAFRNDNRALVTRHGDFSLIALSNALGPSFLNAGGQVQCGTAPGTTTSIPLGSAPGSCVPWNPFYPAGQVGQGSLTGNADLQTYLFPYYHDTGKTTTTDYAANITGSIVTLPAGDLAVATGVEYRRETGIYSPDAMSQAALSTSLSSGTTQGEYTVKSEYIEVAIPLLKDMPFAHELSLDLAARHERYSSFGSTTNPKYSIAWRPIEEVLVRGTFAKGFRAPQIANLFGGLSGTFDSYIDPCDIRQDAGINPAVASRCTGGFGGQPGVPAGFKQIGQGGIVCSAFPCQTGTQFFSGANPLLQPENAISRTAGVAYSPKFEWIPGNLDLSVDWYNIMITNAMFGDTVSSMLHDCYDLGIASRCSSLLFTRDPSTGVVNYALRGLKNAGWVQAKGWDFGVHYVLPQYSFGQFGLTWNTTYVSQLNTRADYAPTTQVVASNGWGGNFRIRSNASLDWQLGPWGATWTSRYYSSMKERCVWDTGDPTLGIPAGGPECNMPDVIINNVVTNVERRGANTFHDLQVRYALPWKAVASFGVNNVFGHFAAPMYTNPSSQYAYYGGFDIGRFYYVRYNQKF